MTVLTLELEGQPFGMVATAVCSLALEPPSILACINKSAFLHDEFAGCTRFGLNILERFPLIPVHIRRIEVIGAFVRLEVRIGAPFDA